MNAADRQADFGWVNVCGAATNDSAVLHLAYSLDVRWCRQTDAPLEFCERGSRIVLQFR
jgi:hypothetical protein